VNNASAFSAFLGLMLRDLRVLRRELGPFVIRIVMQPLLFLFVFTYVFPHLGQGNPMASRSCSAASPQ
jgi:ABC-2 type transport system permease protein